MKNVMEKLTSLSQFIEDCLVDETIKADFNFYYSIIPGMIQNDSKSLKPVSFDGVEVQFLIKLPSPITPCRRAIKLSGSCLVNEKECREAISSVINELRLDFLSRLKGPKEFENDRIGK